MSNQFIRDVGPLSPTASPAAFLREARASVSPTRFGAAISAIWAKAEQGDLNAFRAVAPYLVGQLKIEEAEPQKSVIEMFARVLEQRQQAIAAQAPLQIEQALDQSSAEPEGENEDDAGTGE